MKLMDENKKCIFLVLLVVATCSNTRTHKLCINYNYHAFLNEL